MGLAPLVGQPMDFSKWVFMVKDGEIHAGVPTPTPEQIWIDVESFIEAVPRGAFIGMAELIDCIPTEKMTEAQMLRSRGFGDFSPGQGASRLFLRVGQPGGQ